ncbi:signal peptidase I [Phycisphaerales bacterium]|nr:signal peptidase I [Phycisphaerales bacterium]
MPNPQPKAAQSRSRRFARGLVDWIKSLVVIAAIMIPIRASIADWCDVPTGSMEPTILPGDRIAVNKLAYGLRVPLTDWWVTHWDKPAPGEVVVLHSPKDGVRLVKRLIARPGDTIELRNQHLYINGLASAYSNLPTRWLDETVPDHASRWPAAAFAREQIAGRSHAVMARTPEGVARTFGPITVPPGQYFVMGDNRDLSGDSRIFGFVPEDKIVGRSPGVAISFNPDRYYTPRFDRFFLGFD